MGVRVDMMVVCGGTGGHVYPALAVAEEMRKRYPVRKIMFILKTGGFEEKVIKAAGFDFRSVNMAGFNRSRLLINLRILVLLPLAFVRAFFIMISARPKVVLSTGGYTGVPVLLSAALQRRKIALQEQNSYPGVTVRFFARFAAVIFLAYREAGKYLPLGRRIIEAGNPLRAATGKTEKDLRKEFGFTHGEKVLFVFGGSQGAMAINKVISQCAARLVKEEKIAILWQTGKPDFENMKKSVEGLENVKVFPFIENIYDFYRAADLAVCRSGAMTISELAKFGLPAVFVPLPTAAENHQKKNALTVEAQEAGICVDQSVAQEKLGDTIAALLRDSGRLSDMRTRMKSMHREDAAENIADTLERILAA